MKNFSLKYILTKLLPNVTEKIRATTILFFEYQYFVRKSVVVGFYKICNKNKLRSKFLQNWQEKSIKKIIFRKEWYSKMYQVGDQKTALHL